MAKRSQPTGPYVPLLVPPLFHFVPPIWGLQSCLWPQSTFLAIFSPPGAHWWQFLNGKMVPIHRPICPLTCSTLVPLCSTHSGPPELLMAKKAHLWHFQALFGHKPYPKGWNKVGTKWNTAYLYQTDQIRPKNHSKSALSFSTLCIGVVQVYVWYRYRCGQVLAQ